MQPLHAFSLHPTPHRMLRGRRGMLFVMVLFVAGVLHVVLLKPLAMVLGTNRAQHLRCIHALHSRNDVCRRTADYCGGSHRGSCVSRAIGWENAGTGAADCSTWTTTRLLPRVLGQHACAAGACRISVTWCAG